MHALAGVIAIAKSITRPAPQEASAAGRPPAAAGLSAGETGGWIIIGGLLMAAGALSHAAAGVVQTVREALHTTHP
ncbi:hypothetical protein ACFVHB_37180 [Kitasatospora sp. NPDC127111]|uniref:hypothetical protein n=1 Tax=Kitasatospora sp. NPDC127111 TaxID=3345363 RepID=UPI003627A6D2